MTTRSSLSTHGPVVFVSDIAPSLNYSGGLFTSQIMQAMGPALDRAFVIQDCNLEPELDPAIVPTGFRLQTAGKPNELYCANISMSSIFSAEQTVISGEIPYLVGDIVEFISDLSDPILWVMLEGQTLIRVAYELVQEANVPMIVQVMDPPEWWLRAHNVDPVSQSEVLAKFRAVLRRANGLAAASWAMAEDYGARFGVPAVPVVPSMPSTTALAVPISQERTGAFTIGVAGQLYASDEWRSLVGALDETGWRIAGRDIRIQAHIAETTPPGVSRDQPVTLRPWLPQPELIRELADCDLLYCPYWFDPEFEIEARLRFPPKLTIYLATGRPVLFHGPSYASPARFLDQFEAAFECSSMAPEAIQSTIAAAINDPHRRAAIAATGRAVFDQHLTMERLRDSVTALLVSARSRSPH